MYLLLAFLHTSFLFLILFSWYVCLYLTSYHLQKYLMGSAPPPPHQCIFLSSQLEPFIAQHSYDLFFSLGFRWDANYCSDGGPVLSASNRVYYHSSVHVKVSVLVLLHLLRISWHPCVSVSPHSPEDSWLRTMSRVEGQWLVNRAYIKVLLRNGFYTVFLRT